MGYVKVFRNMEPRVETLEDRVEKLEEKVHEYRLMLSELNQRIGMLERKEISDAEDRMWVPEPHTFMDPYTERALKKAEERSYED